MNKYSINSNPINQTIVDVNTILDNLTFNNYSLQSNSIITEGEGFGLRDYPNRRVNLSDIPQGDGQLLNSTFFGGRTVSIKGLLTADDRSDLETLIDDFKLNLSFPNKLLKWRVNGELRQINATVDDISLGDIKDVYIPFTISFVSQDAFWEKITQQSFLIESLSLNSLSESLYNEGKEVNPIFIVGFNSGATSDFSITSNGIGIGITDTITSGDILYIDGDNNEVKLNGTDINFDGVFPLFENGNNDVQIDIVGTFNCDINIIYPIKLM